MSYQFDGQRDILKWWDTAHWGGIIALFGDFAPESGEGIKDSESLF